VRFRLGQFKPFIGLDNTMLDLQTDFLERSLTQSLFQNLTYDRGVMAFGQPIPGLVYSAALTNGTGQGNDELQGNLQQTQGDGKMYTLRLVGDFAQFFRIPDNVIHFGGTFQRGSEANSGVNAQTPYSAASVQTEARGLTFFTPQAFNPANAAAVTSNINRTAIDIEAAYALWPIQDPERLCADRLCRHANRLGKGVRPNAQSLLRDVGRVITGENYSDWYRDGTFVRPRANNNFTSGPQGVGTVGTQLPL
jgi:phosphate-selective porin OprO/OprP